MPDRMDTIIEKLGDMHTDIQVIKVQQEHQEKLLSDHIAEEPKHHLPPCSTVKSAFKTIFGMIVVALGTVLWYLIKK